MRYLMIMPKISDGKSNFTIVAEDKNHHMETKSFYISLTKFPKEKNQDKNYHLQ